MQVRIVGIDRRPHGGVALRAPLRLGALAVVLLCGTLFLRQRSLNGEGRGAVWAYSIGGIGLVGASALLAFSIGAGLLAAGIVPGVFAVSSRQVVRIGSIFDFLSGRALRLERDDNSAVVVNFGSRGVPVGGAEFGSWTYSVGGSRTNTAPGWLVPDSSQREQIRVAIESLGLRVVESAPPTRGTGG